MTLRLRITVTLALVVTGLLGPYTAAAMGAGSRGIEPLWGPYITGTTETLTTINWKTGDPTWGVVEYATEEQYALGGGYDSLVVDPAPGQLHQVTITGLQPDEAYRYRVWILEAEVSSDSLPSDAPGEIEGWLQEHAAATPDFSFRTLGGQSFMFVVYGDTQEQYPWFTQMERHKLVADYIAREQGISFVVHLGDFTYDADYVPGWDVFFQAAREMLANNSIYPVMGNHDEYSAVYHDLFGKPETYSFRSGEARFLVLDTNSRADFEAQRGWLQEELSSAAKWSLVFYHHPAYSSDARNYGGWRLSREHWEDVLVSAGVTAVFSGHVHAYERYLVRGLNHFVVGTGGGALSDLSPDAPAGLQNRLAKTLGYSRVTVEPDEVTVAFLPVARVSDDNREVLETYPFGTVFESVSLQPMEGDRSPWSPEADFRVAPVSLDIDVDRHGSSSFRLRVTSGHDARIHVDTEDLPFAVEPAIFRVQGSGEPEWLDLELLGNEAVGNGEYEGRLTVLRDAGDNVALGVKVRTTVTQTGEELGFLERASENDIYLIIAVALLLVADIGGYLAYRRYKARISGAKGV